MKTLKSWLGAVILFGVIFGYGSSLINFDFAVIILLAAIFAWILEMRNEVQLITKKLGIETEE